MKLLNMRLQEIQEHLNSRQIKVSELVNESFQRIQELEPKLNAFITRNEEKAREEAKRMDEQLMNNEQRGPLFGLPAGINDNIITEGLRTTCASQILANYIPIYNATVMDKLQQAQSITMGKLNMDEFAMGSSSEHSAYQPVHNPWNLDRGSGGASGGAAAAVSAQEVCFALASDTGGSIRIPAAHCGVVGLKPTFGLVSRFGLVANASTFDQIGPITKTVEDAATVLQVIAGHDVKDATSAKVEIPNYVNALTGEIKGLNIGIPKQCFGEDIHPEIRERLSQALKVLENLGAQIVEVSLPHTEYALATYYILSSAEASSNLARYDGIRYGVRSRKARDLHELYQKSRSEGFGAEVKKRILLGTYVLSSEQYETHYVKAQKVRTLIQQDFINVFQQVDVLITPTTPTIAAPLGTETHDPISLNERYTIPASLAGVPAITVPCGFVDGLPVGMQIMGKAFDEATILKVAHAFEQHTDHHQARPQL